MGIGRVPDVVTPEMAAGLARVIAAATTQAALAAALDINRSAVHRWRRVPIEHVVAIEKLFGVPRAVQRPDVFGESE